MLRLWKCWMRIPPTPAPVTSPACFGSTTTSHPQLSSPHWGDQHPRAALHQQPLFGSINHQPAARHAAHLARGQTTRPQSHTFQFPVLEGLLSCSSSVHNVVCGCLQFSYRPAGGAHTHSNRGVTDITIGGAVVPSWGVYAMGYSLPPALCAVPACPAVRPPRVDAWPWS